MLVGYSQLYIDTLKAKNPDSHMVTFISNHDMDRAAGFLTVSSGHAHMSANLAVLMPGSTFIYYGDEIGMKGSRGGAATDANRRLAMLWGDGDTVKNPEGTDYKEKQPWLRKVITNAIHEEARDMLPPRLEALAEREGFKYSRCSVRNSHSRWGSCSGKGNISLSIYLVLLADELIDYVLLHELCHTVEMNHGERFWAMLDKVCKGNSRKIRGRLKKHTPDI